MSHTTTYIIAGESVDFPDVASGVAIKNAAKRFEANWGLPPEAAFSLAASMVDPAEDRAQINPKAPYEHLQAIQTPGGEFLLAHRTRVWTSMISGDGGNGRSRFAIQTTNKDGKRARPWPIGRHHKPAVIDYHTPALSDMTSALRISAAQIRSEDLMTQIGRNRRGIWNPPVVVLARAHVGQNGDTVEQRWFQHTVEGSTRVEACHELTQVDATAPLENSDSPLDHLRGTHGALVERFTTTPSSARTLAAARAATMPALIVVAAVEGDGETFLRTGFPATINDYVESVHVQPRPFSDAAQSNVIGERFILTLESERLMTHEDAEAVLGRGQHIAGKPSVRAAKLVHAVCDPTNDALLRDFVITNDNAKLTKVKRARLIGPLVVRQFDEAAPSAERTLMRPFTPELLLRSWEVTGVDSETLRRACLKDVRAGIFDSDHIAELVARGGPALCASGLLLGDQESTVKGITELRGSVDKVLEALIQNLGGINVLADAIAWADREKLERPRRFDIEGRVELDRNKEVLHFGQLWSEGNMGVRALAFTQGKIPSGKSEKTPEVLPERTPEQVYRAFEEKLFQHVMAGQAALKDLYTVKDEDGIRLIEKLGLQKIDAFKRFPIELNHLYAKYVVDDNLLGIFEEDDLPDSETYLESEEDDWVESDETDTDDDTDA